LAAIAARHGVSERTISYRLAKERDAADPARAGQAQPADEMPATPDQAPPQLHVPQEITASPVRSQKQAIASV